MYGILLAPRHACLLLCCGSFRKNTTGGKGAENSIIFSRRQENTHFVWKQSGVRSADRTRSPQNPESQIVRKQQMLAVKSNGDTEAVPKRSELQLYLATAGALAVELMAAVLQLPMGVEAPLASSSVEDGALGGAPHMIRGQLSGFSQLCLSGDPRTSFQTSVAGLCHEASEVSECVLSVQARKCAFVGSSASVWGGPWRR